jgi:hypothetical protein
MPKQTEQREFWTRAYVGLLGAGALAAWFALLWFMFGDVL